jgi:hypothetical protein
MRWWGHVLGKGRRIWKNVFYKLNMSRYICFVGFEVVADVSTLG